MLCWPWMSGNSRNSSCDLDGTVHVQKGVCGLCEPAWKGIALCDLRGNLSAVQHRCMGRQKNQLNLMYFVSGRFTNLAENKTLNVTENKALVWFNPDTRHILPSKPIEWFYWGKTMGNADKENEVMLFEWFYSVSFDWLTRYFAIRNQLMDIFGVRLARSWHRQIM